MRGVTALVCGVLASLVIWGTADASDIKSWTLQTKGPSPYWLAMVKGSKFSVDVTNSVTSECWEDEDGVKDAVVLEFKRNGFNATDKIMYGFWINLNVTGAALNDRCFLLLSFHVYWPVPHQIKLKGHSITYPANFALLWTNEVLLLGGKKQEIYINLKNATIELAEKFLIDMEKNKTKVIEVLAESAMSPDTKRYLENYQIE